MNQEIYYNPSILGCVLNNSNGFSRRDSRVEEQQKYNDTLFLEHVHALIWKSRKESDDYKWDEDVLDEGSKGLKSLFRDYVERTESSYFSNDLSIHLLKWLIHTYKCIESAFRNVTPVSVTFQKKGGNLMTVYYEYEPFCAYLLISLCQDVINEVNLFVKEPTPSSSLLIYYNFWGEVFDRKYRDLFPKRAGLIEEDDKALVSPYYNKEKYGRQIFFDWDHFFDDEYSMYYVVDDDTIEVHTEDLGIRRFYNDYQRRVYIFCGDGFDDRDKFNLQVEWVLSSIRLGLDAFSKMDSLSTNNCGSDSILGRYKIVFTCYFSHLLEILSSLLQNHDYYFSSIEVEKTPYSLGSYNPELIGQIYDHMISKLKRVRSSEGFKSWNRDDFIKRVYSASLKPYWIEGAISAMKFNIKKIREEAGDGWLKAVANNIGISPDEARGKYGYDLPNGYETSFPSPKKPYK